MLVTGALKLLFRHFNQRQELVTALKNVQAGYKSNLWLNYCQLLVISSRYFCNQLKLLISKTNVDQYEQIKDDVEELRTLTEESELWIPSCSVKATPEEEKKRRAYLHENIKKAKIIIRDSRIYFEDEVGSLQNFSPVNSCDFDRLESALGLETSKEASLNYKKLQVK